MSNKAVIFENNTEMDPRAWSVMGLSGKEKDDPIGVFGTGLKMSLSILLRTGHKVKIVTGGKEYNFSLKAESFRGKDYQQVYCNDEPLPFTTNLGKNWKVWQAFREIWCNTLDESGMARPYKGGDIFATGVIVEGEEFYDVFTNKEKYFLSPETKLTKGGNVEIHSGQHKFFHRGNLAGDNFATLYNYNFLAGVQLTEERTLVCDWNLKWEIARCITQITDKNIIRAVLTAPSDTVEGSLDWDVHYPAATEEFKEIAQTLYEGKIGENSK